MESNNVVRILNFLYYFLNAVGALLWFGMMCLPVYVMSNLTFKVILSVYMVCGISYAFIRNKYLPKKKYSKMGKIVFAAMAILLFIRIVFF